jgi:hypothetical protein
MDRFILLQKIIDTNRFKTYLEIGTFHGRSFFPLKCKNKIAVDPHFQFTEKNKRNWKLKNLCNIRNKYFEKTSDDFFNEEKAFLEKLGTIDLIFIDGLHTFQASLSDALNALKYISIDGFIVMHDCYPPHNAAAKPAKNLREAETMNLPGWTGEWCGDVWKTIVYLKEKYGNDLKIHTLNTDYGLGIIQIKNPDLDLKIDQELFDRIDRFKYEEVNNKFSRLLNLKEVHELNLIL